MEASYSFIIWPPPCCIDQLRDTRLISAWLARRIISSITQTISAERIAHLWFDTSATSLFLERRLQLAKVSFSALRISDHDLALELFFKLQSCEADFHSLAHFSSGDERFSGGQIGPVYLKSLQPSVQEALRGAPIGKLLNPIRAESKETLLLRLNHRLDARLDDQTRAELEQDLFNDWINQEIKRILELCPHAGDRVPLFLPGPIP